MGENRDEIRRALDEYETELVVIQGAKTRREQWEARKKFLKGHLGTHSTPTCNVCDMKGTSDCEALRYICKYTGLAVTEKQRGSEIYFEMGRFGGLDQSKSFARISRGDKYDLIE